MLRSDPWNKFIKRPDSQSDMRCRRHAHATPIVWRRLDRLLPAPLIDRRAQSQEVNVPRRFTDYRIGCAGRGRGNIQSGAYICAEKERAFMSEERDDQERPCLHCMIVELIDDFFAEYPATTGEPDTIDTDEVITAIAKTVAELTCSQDGAIRQQLIERLMSEIVNYDTEFRRDDGTGAIGSVARH